MLFNQNKQEPNSDTPFARVGSQVFMGRHEETVGSMLLMQLDRALSCSFALM